MLRWGHYISSWPTACLKPWAHGPPVDESKPSPGRPQLPNTELNQIGVRQQHHHSTHVGLCNGPVRPAGNGPPTAETAWFLLK
jgi:hypothetical protein